MDHKKEKKRKSSGKNIKYLLSLHCFSLYSKAAWNSKVMIMRQNYVVRPVYICVYFALLHKIYPTFCVIAKCDVTVHM